MKKSAKALLVINLIGMSLLAGCGGSTTTPAPIGGTVIGLSGGTSVSLLNNNADPITVSANTSFTFDVQVNSGSTYNVTIGTQPVGETCTVTNGLGTVDSFGDAVTDVIISCAVSS